MRVALAQLDPTIGDFTGNVAKITRAYEEACAKGADLVVYPELAIPGYPPKDLVEEPAFIEANLAALDEVAGRAKEVPAIVGFIDRRPKGSLGRGLYNAAAVLQGGAVSSVHHKGLLPTYDVFDELRHFEPATSYRVAQAAGVSLGITVCEDAWNDPEFFPERLYRDDPVALLARQGAELLINISASPFTLEKRTLRLAMLAAHARKHARSLVFVNQVGGQDDLIFDGHSVVLDARGEVIACAKEFEEDLVLVDLEHGTGEMRPTLPSDDAAAFAALVLGTRDYAHKCGFKEAVIGLSGGIDSSLVAVVAAQALGKENVRGVAMPSRFSSSGSLEDAAALAAALGIRYDVVPIEPPFEAFLGTLSRYIEPGETEAGAKAADLTRQNIQARIRGTILMALSNRWGSLVLSTGNKSEIAVGYCTLYGDMAGGLDVLSDVPKMMVYRLARYANQSAPVIPESVFTKAPSAELRPDQTDQDSLPPYETLDALIERHVEEQQSRQALVAGGFAPALVDDFLGMVRRSEYKRRQMPPGLKITSKAFGPGRRMPIAHRWRG